LSIHKATNIGWLEMSNDPTRRSLLDPLAFDALALPPAFDVLALPFPSDFSLDFGVLLLLPFPSLVLDVLLPFPFDVFDPDFDALALPPAFDVSALPFPSDFSLDFGALLLLPFPSLVLDVLLPYPFDPDFGLITLSPSLEPDLDFLSLVFLLSTLDPVLGALLPLLSTLDPDFGALLDTGAPGVNGVGSGVFAGAGVEPGFIGAGVPGLTGGGMDELPPGVGTGVPAVGVGGAVFEPLPGVGAGVSEPPPSTRGCCWSCCI
jgi:hypothetical protein